MGGKHIRKEQHAAFADAICNEVAAGTIAQRFGVNVRTVHDYYSFARGYAAGSTPADKRVAMITYYKLGENIRNLIAENIDAGRYFSLGYKKNKTGIEQYGPHTSCKQGKTQISNPIKEEGPVAVQQKLPLQNPGCSEKRGPASRNEVDTNAILMRTLDAIIELCQAIRAIR